MRLEQAPDLREEMLNLLKKEYISGSREGVHLTSLIYCLTKTFWEETDPLPPSEDEVLLWSIGFALERVLIKGMEMVPQRLDDTGRCWRCNHEEHDHRFTWCNCCSCPGYIPDGIWVSPDFYLHGPSDLKTTRLAPDKSAGCLICGEPYTGHTKAKMGHTYEKNPEKVPFELPEGWRRQFKGYRYAENQDEHRELASLGWRFKEAHGHPYPFNVAILHLVQPELQVLRAWFSAEELEENWKWVLERRETLRRMRATNKPEPFLHNEKWECENCRYRLRCDLTVSLEMAGKEANMERFL